MSETTGGHPLIDLKQGATTGSFRLLVTDDLCVGPTDNVFLFGGAALAAGITAIESTLAKAPIWATAQFVSYARIGDVLDIVVEVLQSGRNVDQAMVVARVGGERLFTVLAAAGERGGHPFRQWIQMPAMPAPDDCVPANVWPEQGARLIERLDVRQTPAATAIAAGVEGRTVLWIRMVDRRPVDAATLALFADFVPAGVAAAIGGKGGGNSMDNMLRICAQSPTQWVLADIRVHAIGRGMAHGDVRLFAEDGTLLAVGSQSLVVRTLPH